MQESQDREDSRDEPELPFWDHIDELRGVATRIVVAFVVAIPIIFCLKKPLFEIILAPSKSDFIVYRAFSWIASHLPFAENLSIDSFHVELINIELASQFFIHIKTSIFVAFVIIFPYIIAQLYGFIAPALHSNQRQYSTAVILSSFMLFISGVLLSYFIIFPFSFRFLSTYQVTTEVANMISLSSYMGTFLSLSLMMGIVFEIPILTWLLAKMGVITYDMLREFRKHVFVVVLIISAIITPTGDIITLALVAMPIYLLHELSLLAIKRI
ncbi:MAG: twin-arginine translocase subunit TatC [Rikenellaceae bacterium]